MYLTPEEELLDTEFYTLLRPSFGADSEGSGHLPSAECEAGKYYWGFGRRISEVAICRGVSKQGAMQFEGLREKLGADYLDIELHYDDDPYFGTFSPFLELGEIPELDSEDATMSWILDQEIALNEARLDWLKAMPARLKAAPAFRWTLSATTGELEDLKHVREAGFCHEPWSYKKILADRAKQQAEEEVTS